MFLLSRNIFLLLDTDENSSIRRSSSLCNGLDVKGGFPFKSVPFVHVCVQEYKF